MDSSPSWSCHDLAIHDGAQQAVEVWSPGAPRGRHGLEQQRGVGREPRGAQRDAVVAVRHGRVRAADLELQPHVRVALVAAARAHRLPGPSNRSLSA